MPAAVDVAGEGDAFLTDLGQPREAHHLIAAAVGEDRPLPTHEPVQPAQARNPLGAGSQHQMIGVAQDDIGPRRAHFLRAHRFDRRRRTDGHKGRRANLAADGRDSARTRGAVSPGDGEVEAGHSRGGLALSRTQATAAKRR